MMISTTTTTTTTSITITEGAIKRKPSKRARFVTAVADRILQDSVTIDDFTILQSSHPHGVLPTGNRFYCSNNNSNKSDHDSNTTSDANKPMDVLPNEECWNTILSYCDGVSLWNICHVGRFFYVASQQPELWRDLVLIQKKKRTTKQSYSDTNNNHTNDDRDQNTITQFGSSWRETYLINMLQSRHKTTTTNNKAYHPRLQQQQQHVHTVPISVKGYIYSDYYYRLHTCRSFSIPQRWLLFDDNDDNINHVHVIPVQEMTVERFLNQYEIPNIPVNIKNGCQTWQATMKWSDSNYMTCQTQQQTFRATSGVAPYPAQFTLNAYRKYCMGYDHCTNDDHQPPQEEEEEEHLLEEGPLYLFDRTALQPQSILWNDYMYDLQRTCPYWDPNNHHMTNDNNKNNNGATITTTSTINGGHDLFGLLGEGRRPDHTWLICGPKRSGSVFHIDPNGTHAWNATIVGHKRWIFYPPGITPPGVYPSTDGDEVALPLTIGEWIYQYWDEHCERKRTAVSAKDRPLECTTRPGDVIFVPHGWWHLVINLDEWNIAITHNYVSRSNLCNVLRFLRDKREQVSGCRDRNESIKPENLYEEFVSTLQQHHPKWLQEALNIPDWTCQAWKKSITVTKDKYNVVSTTTSVIERAKSGDNTSFSFSFDP